MKADGFRDIRGPVALPGDWWWLWVLAAVILLVGAFWAVRLALRALRRPVAPAAPIPPWEKALAQITRLETLRPDGETAVKAFFFDLSDVIRVYIEERFNIRAPEMTTEEFMERVRHSSDLSKEQQGFLSQFLNLSDMVKFARHQPSAFDRAEVLASARLFVQSTRGSR